MFLRRITSYNEVAAAFPSDETLKRIAGMKLNDEEWTEAFDHALGELFSTEFFRVVLDEAHAIKNQLTRSKDISIPFPYHASPANNPIASKACMQLSARYRWAVTGTPLINSVDGEL